MPAVARTSDEAIIAAARRIVDREGAAALSMLAVAGAVGVQAPSLYKRFRDRSALLRAVAQDVVTSLQRVHARAANTGSPIDDLRAVAIAQRRFARRSPHLYTLVFGPREAETEPSDAEYASLVAVVFDRLRSVGQPERALDTARMLVSYTHGFISMELAGAFRLGGDLDKAYAFGLDALLRSVAPRRRR